MIQYTRQIAVWGMSLLIATSFPAISQAETFKTLTLDKQTTSGTMTGTTGGTTSLPAVVSNSDRQNQKCIGFGDPTPYHTLVLKQPFSSLTLRVNSGGGDTTLLVSGPGGVRCAAAGESGADAGLQQGDWQSGTYQIWVGTMTPNTNLNYRLTVKGN